MSRRVNHSAAVKLAQTSSLSYDQAGLSLEWLPDEKAIRACDAAALASGRSAMDVIWAVQSLIAGKAQK